MALVDLLAVLPFYLPLLLPFDLRVLRILRLFRIFRLAKIGRYSESMKVLTKVMQNKREELLISLSTTAIMLVLISSLMYYVERDIQPEAFSSIPATMWWGIATMTTVGYGDVYPLTAVGRILGATVCLLGIGVFALPAGIIASGLSDAMRRRGKTRHVCPHCGKDFED